jgi:hypothetical protein
MVLRNFCLFSDYMGCNPGDRSLHRYHCQALLVFMYSAPVGAAPRPTAQREAPKRETQCRVACLQASMDTLECLLPGEIAAFRLLTG